MSINVRNESDWERFLSEAQDRVLQSRLEWDPQGIFRAEDGNGGSEGDDETEDPSGNDGEDGEDGGKPKPQLDLGDPKVRAAIAAETQRAIKAAREEWDAETEGLKAKKDELLTKLKRQKEELEKLHDDAAASKVGAKSEEFTAAVEEAAQRKSAAFRREHSELLEAKENRIKEQEAQIAELQKKVHRSFIHQEIARATIRPEHRMVHDGAEEALVSLLEPAIVAEHIEGLPFPVARVKVDGVKQPAITGSTPDGLMDMSELLDQMRQGKGPIPNASYYFRSTGRGSGTHSPETNGKNAAGGNWAKMTPEQRANYTREHGPAAAKELMSKAAAQSAASS